MTRSSQKWACKPGSYDTLHIRQQFESDNAWGMPTLPVVPRSAIPHWLAPFRQRIRTKDQLHDGARHFFLDDYRFETVWGAPVRALTHLKETGSALTPDFSLYQDFPRPAQIWNTYRNRWCGAYWANEGLTVIPTVSWSDASSYEFCFAGLPRHSVLAISTVGILVGSVVKRHLFWMGLQEMIARLEPTVILCYGAMPTEYEIDVDVIEYPTRWTNIKAARKNKYE